MLLRKFTKAKPPDFYCGCHDHKTIASLSRVQGVDDHMKWRLTYIRKLTKLLFSLKDNKSLMAMETVFVCLACCLLAFSLATITPTDMGNLSSVASLTNRPTITIPGLNLTHTTTVLAPSNSSVDDVAVPTTVISNLTEDTALFTSTPQDSTPLTKTTAATTNESTNHPQTSQSVPIWTSVTNDASLTSPNHDTQSPFTAQTIHPIQTTVDSLSTPDTIIISTANASLTINTTSYSMHSTTQGQRDLGLDTSEKNIAILFSIVLGVFALALAMFMFHKYKQRNQYLHQPLYNDTDQFAADDDTLVISGGLYDGHPTYDDVPTATTEQSQFGLEFLQ